jgi:hypothetical protein
MTSLLKPLSKKWLLLISILSVVFSSCNKVDWIDIFKIKDKGSKQVYVSDVNQLYAAINNTANAGFTIIVAPGTYLLDGNHPNGGRLDLGYDMSLTGQAGHPEAVVIDVTGLPASSFALPPSPTFPGNSRTGAIRMGNGDNSIEWMTLQNDPSHSIRSLIQTDLVNTPLTKIRIAHTIIKGSAIGINLKNQDVPSNGRTVEAEIEDNEIVGNIISTFGSGIQIQNSMNVTGATIRATLKRNYIHGNLAGIVAFHGSSIQNTIAIKSYSDRIDGNGLGLALMGGFGERFEYPAKDNFTSFDAYGTTVRNNLGAPLQPPIWLPGGVFAASAIVPETTKPGAVYNNKVQINFWGCFIEGNAGPFNINAFGAYSLYPSTTPAGSNNNTTILLDGLSRNVKVNAIGSFPDEPAGTNTVNINR